MFGETTLGVFFIDMNDMKQVQKRNEKLLAWFEKNQRKMPWRETKDPYAIWVSEIMLQQTRVDTVIPYYLRWMEQFPSVETLAQADQEQVLKLWEGLGYYSRARNLHKAAQQVAKNSDGIIPNDKSELIKLKGIGPYTAAAIASIAFDQPEALVDGNVKRVLSRWFDFDIAINTPQGEKHCWQIAEEIMNVEHPRDHNQALMELGALICTPTSPNCNDCPIYTYCLSYKNQTQAIRPVKEEKKPIPLVNVVAAVILNEDHVLISKRPQKDMLGGMWEYAGGKLEPGEDMHQALIRELKEELNIDIMPIKKLGEYRHAYTHFKVYLEAHFANIVDDSQMSLDYHEEIKWVPVDRLNEYAMSKIDRMISNDLKKVFDEQEVSAKN